MQPTMEFFPSPSNSEHNTLDVSRANVGFVAGERAHFADETASLLRIRLVAAATAMAAVLALAFAGNLVSGITNLWWFRGLILLGVVGSLWVLAHRPSLKLSQLRIVELIVFGSVALQLSLMLLSRMAEVASQNDAVSLVSLCQQFLMAWCVLIFTYGTLIPNTWKRGGLIMISAAALPYFLIAIQRWLMPEVALLLDSDIASSPLPLPIVSALVAIFATHVINSSRRDAFKARQFGQYHLADRIGAGGMGEVYRAEHMMLKRPCAIKLIKPTNDNHAMAVARFEKEVKATAKLTHWNTIEIYDYGRTEDGTFYYVMELLPGMSLEDLVGQYGPMPPERVVYLLIQICGALSEAHAVGLIHRDIKPANIFASQRGGLFDVAKLLDFGLVKEGDDRPEEGAGGGAFSGTPLYMSPEQASAYAEVDGRADIYSLGAVAYHLLTGRPPFTSKNVLDLLAAHRSREVELPTSVNSSIPAALERIILKCMAKARSERFQSTVELQLALENLDCASQWGSVQAQSWWRAVALQPPVGPLENTETKETIVPVETEATLDFL